MNNLKVDLIDCSEMMNGELAEADQTCRSEASGSGSGGGGAAAAAGGGDALPDVVDTDEATPTEVTLPVLYCRCFPLYQYVTGNK